MLWLCFWTKRGIDWEVQIAVSRQPGYPRFWSTGAIFGSTVKRWGRKRPKVSSGIVRYLRVGFKGKPKICPEDSAWCHGPMQPAQLWKQRRNLRLTIWDRFGVDKFGFDQKLGRPSKFGTGKFGRWGISSSGIESSRQVPCCTSFCGLGPLHRPGQINANPAHLRLFVFFGGVKIQCYNVCVSHGLIQQSDYDFPLTHMGMGQNQQIVMFWGNQVNQHP